VNAFGLNHILDELADPLIGVRKGLVFVWVHLLFLAVRISRWAQGCSVKWPAVATLIRQKLSEVLLT
jgi:hypothetical protein